MDENNPSQAPDPENVEQPANEEQEKVEHPGACSRRCTSPRCQAYRAKMLINTSKKVIVWLGEGFSGAQCPLINGKVEPGYLSTWALLREVVTSGSIRAKFLRTVTQRGKKPFIVWVLGGPGSGKGTQCDKIVAQYGFVHLSTGNLLREEVNVGSIRGQNLTAIMDLGELVPNELVLELLKEAIQSHVDTAHGFLIDGYPREKDQGVAFEQTIAPCNVILYFEASPETLTKRLLGRNTGRADDNEETIKLRLKTFVDHTEHVLAQYPDKLARIDAEQSPEAIFVEVQKILDLVLSAG